MKTLWFRDTYIVFVLSSKFRPRVIPMLDSFYLIVYLICISYFIYSYYIYLYLIIIISFFVCRLLYRIPFIIVIFYFMFVVFGIRIGIILSLTSLYVLSLGFCVCLCFLGSMIISGILFIYYFHMRIFIFMCYMGSLAYDYLFSFFVCCFGLWVYNPCDMDYP